MVQVWKVGGEASFFLPVHVQAGLVSIPCFNQVKHCKILWKMKRLSLHLAIKPGAELPLKAETPLPLPGETLGDARWTTRSGHKGKPGVYSGDTKMATRGTMGGLWLRQKQGWK